MFHVSFENGTPLTSEERSNPWNAVGVRLLHQLLDKPIAYIRNRFVAEPSTVFQLVAAAENVDLYDDLTGILVIDGIQKALTGYDDGRNKDTKSCSDCLIRHSKQLLRNCCSCSKWLRY